MPQDTKIETEQDLLVELDNFIGSGEFFRWNPALFRRDIMTEGVHFLVERAGAFWLADLIASHQSRLDGQDFQIWFVQVKQHGDKRSATAWCQDDQPGRVLVKQEIEYTDFPLGLSAPFRLYAARNELGGVTIMLPSEY